MTNATSGSLVVVSNEMLNDAADNNGIFLVVSLLAASKPFRR